MEKILLAEDEKEIANVIVSYLEKRGNHNVSWYKDGESALDSFKENNFDLLILDIMLPKIDGIAICKEVRKQSNVPIIILTALGEETDKVLGLELGADDYIVKPFSPRELLARVNAILRRASGKTEVSNDVLSVGELKIDCQKYEVFYKDKKIDFTRSEFEILHIIAKSPERVFSRSQLLNEIQGQYFEAYERTIDTHIKNIRKKLQKVGVKSIIKTVHGIGYKLEMEVA